MKKTMLSCCGRPEGECVCPPESSKQDKLLLTELAETIYQGEIPDEYHLADEDEELKRHFKRTARKILAKVKQHNEQKRLEEHEIKHIEIALKDHYKDEWCSICDNVARKQW